jgi:hypothetical protein
MANLPEIPDIQAGKAEFKGLLAIQVFKICLFSMEAF